MSRQFYDEAKEYDLFRKFFRIVTGRVNGCLCCNCIDEELSLACQYRADHEAMNLVRFACTQSAEPIDPYHL